MKDRLQPLTYSRKSFQKNGRRNGRRPCGIFAVVDIGGKHTGRAMAACDHSDFRVAIAAVHHLKSGRRNSFNFISVRRGRNVLDRDTVDRTGLAASAAANPHNQILAVGIQLGLVGIAVLLAMWLAHLLLFQSSTFAAWVGLVVVIQNIVGSLFNSHLFDFTHGWAYVIGVGVADGIVLRELTNGRQAGSRAAAANH